jgi:hypothetical protein
LNSLKAIRTWIIVAGKMANTKNNHYISRYLTRPWEFKPGKVTIFDYEKSEFSEADTETLFSKNEIFTQKQETFFNKYIETISTQELRTIADRDFKIKKWKVYRAFLLLIWDLLGRFKAAQEGDASAVNFFTAMSEEQLDQFALAVASKYDLMVATVPAEARLFFPSNFVVYAFDPETMECGFGIPFSIQEVLLLVPKGANLEYFNQLSKNHFFPNISMGNLKTDFVVIPPDVEKTEEVARN